MTATTVELEQLKRKLLLQYKDEIARLSARELGSATALASTPRSAENKNGDSKLLSSFPSVSSLTLQLLCLREGRCIRDVPTTAREQVAMMAHAMPTPDVLVEDRLRHAQDESVRLLVKRTALVTRAPAYENVGNGDEYDADAAKSAEANSIQQNNDQVAATAPVAFTPVTAAERLELLERMYASNLKVISEIKRSEDVQAAEDL